MVTRTNFSFENKTDCYCGASNPARQSLMEAVNIGPRVEEKPEGDCKANYVLVQEECQQN